MRGFCLTRCPVCGLMYAEDIASDRRLHNTRHKKCLDAINRYGFFWSDYEEVKDNARSNIHNQQLNFQEKFEAVETILKSFFSRSLAGVDFSVRHPTFKDYAAMMLCDPTLWERNGASQDVYRALCVKYGIKYGVIPLGYSVWLPPGLRKRLYGEKSQKCPICGLGYIYPLDNRIHKATHQKCLTAIDKNGFFWSNYEETKEDGRLALRNENSGFQEKFEGTETILKSYFSRSLAGCDFSPKHPGFKEYAAILLSDWGIWEVNGVPKDVYRDVCIKYGTKPGIIPLGSTHWVSPKHKKVSRKGI